MLGRGPVLWFSPEDQTPNATGFVRAPQRPDDRKFGSSRVLQINLPPPALSIRSRRPDHRPRQSVAFWFSRAPRRGSLQRTSHATPIFGRVRPLTLQAAQQSPARGWPRDHAAAQSLARTPLARQQPAPALPPPTPSSAVDNAADITHARENFELISLCSSPRAQPRLRVRCGRYIAGSRARRDRRCSITNVRRRNDARADCRDDHTQAVVLKKT